MGFFNRTFGRKEKDAESAAPSLESEPAPYPPPTPHISMPTVRDSSLRIEVCNED
jgi:hypothetical protein